MENDFFDYDVGRLLLCLLFPHPALRAEYLKVFDLQCREPDFMLQEKRKLSNVFAKCLALSISLEISVKACVTGQKAG